MVELSVAEFSPDGVNGGARWGSGLGGTGSSPAMGDQKEKLLKVQEYEVTR